MIYIGADHNGHELKEKIKKYFEKKSISYADLGAHEFDKDDDYVDFAEAVAKKVVGEENARGILICKSGNGMAIAANKIKEARAAVVFDKESTESAVSEDHANIIALSSRGFGFFSKRKKLIPIVKAFMNSKYSQASRHVRRVKKISSLEK